MLFDFVAETAVISNSIARYIVMNFVNRSIVYHVTGICNTLKQLNLTILLYKSCFCFVI
jgi:hypothetical protein